MGLGSISSKEEVQTHFFFGQVSQRDQFNKELMVVIKQLLSQDQYDLWERGYHKAINMNKKSLFLAESSQMKHVKKCFTCCECPANYEISVMLVFERFDHLYKQQIARRQSAEMFYNQEELFLILYELAGGVKEFQCKGMKFGDIRPSQMIITTTNKIKMINLYSYPWEITSMDKIMDKYDNKTKFYLAPEEIQYLNSPSESSDIPNPKTEAFSLGLSILQAALLKNSEDIYEVNPRKISMLMLNKRIDTLKHSYPNLKRYLELLLKEQPQQRYSCGQLWSLLKVYAEDITHTRKFTRKVDEENRSLQNFKNNTKINDSTVEIII